jgi:hypothetical protein
LGLDYLAGDNLKPQALAPLETLAEAEQGLQRKVERHDAVTKQVPSPQRR